MNAPFTLSRETIRAVDLKQPDEAARLEGFVAQSGGSVFHRPAWLLAVEDSTGQTARGLIAEKSGRLTGWLPLTELHSPVFGRALASSGFGVEGGVLADDTDTIRNLCSAVQEYALRLSCPTIELRGPTIGEEWQLREDSHCGFVAPLRDDEESQLKAIPRKQRAEVRKGLRNSLRVSIGSSPIDRANHFAVYSESVRNLGTPVFPKRLFAAVLDRLDSDILTISEGGTPVASVLSLYHDGAVMPYWGGGTRSARHRRANDRMYFELMLHARARGCDRFDFGRSKTGSGAWSFKKNWGFDPQPLSYASWTAPGHEARDADPTSAQHQMRIALWKKLPLPLANRLGPLIARGLG
ncbi:MAG: FemAB family XrtA/PEP-CTERM system-associated protein [Alteraurantiacibacter sp.]